MKLFARPLDLCGQRAGGAARAFPVNMLVVEVRAEAQATVVAAQEDRDAAQAPMALDDLGERLADLALRARIARAEGLFVEQADDLGAERLKLVVRRRAA